MSSRKFHHGNLRASLIELATAELAKGNLETLSLRELAMRLGVSRGAPYRHFSSKEQLLQQVVEEGLRKVAASYEHAEKMNATPKEKLRAACRAYLDLAARNPGLFNLFFFTDAYTGQPVPTGRTSNSPFGIFERLVAAAQGIADPKKARSATLTAWSLIHGFAILRMHGRIRRFASADDIEGEVLDMVCGERPAKR